MKKYTVALTLHVDVEATSPDEAQRVAFDKAWELIGEPHRATVTAAQTVCLIYGHER